MPPRARRRRESPLSRATAASRRPPADATASADAGAIGSSPRGSTGGSPMAGISAYSSAGRVSVKDRRSPRRPPAQVPSVRFRLLATARWMPLNHSERHVQGAVQHSSRCQPSASPSSGSRHVHLVHTTIGTGLGTGAGSGLRPVSSSERRSRPLARPRRRRTLPDPICSSRR